MGQWDAWDGGTENAEGRTNGGAQQLAEMIRARSRLGAGYAGSEPTGNQSERNGTGSLVWPLSLGSAQFPLIGRDLCIEVKARADGFRELYSWLAHRDVLIVKADRQPPLVVVRLALASEVAGYSGEGKSTLENPSSRTL
jgi:hypothetical protein